MVYKLFTTMSTQQACQLCMNYIEENQFADLDDDILKRLQFLQINLNLKGEEGHLICSKCNENIENIFDFKSWVIINTKSNASTKKDITTKRSREILKESLMCHLCKNSNDCMISFLKVLEEDTTKDLLQGHLQEVDLENLENPMVCENCQKSLSMFRELVESWWKTKSWNDNDNIDDEGEFKYEIENGNMNSTSPSTLSYDNQRTGNDNREHGELASGSGSSYSIKDGILNGNDNANHNEVAELGELKLKTEEIDIKDEDEILEDHLNHHRIVHEDRNPAKTFNCHQCSCQIYIKNIFNQDLQVHKKVNVLEENRCKQCLFLSNECSFVKQHKTYSNLQKHKTSDEVQMYKCNECFYGFRRKGTLKEHLLTHKSLDTVRTYKCDECFYRSKRKGDLNKHMLIHKSLDEIQTYKCNECHYIAKRKCYLMRHTLKHKTSYEVIMYKCSECSYETKRRETLKQHLLTHKSLDKIQKFICNECPYGARRKYHLKMHLLKHKTLDEVEMYKCNECLYRSKRKGDLKRHMVRHHQNIR